jgi:hypothetical protein
MLQIQRAKVSFCRNFTILFIEKERSAALGVHLDLRLSLVNGPLFGLVLKTALSIPEGAQGPDTSPDERNGPADHVGSILLNTEDKGSDHSSCHLATDTPEKGQTVKHLTEVVTGFVSGVESLAEFNVTAAVDCNDVLDDPVDSRAELGASRHGRDTERGGDLEKTHGILNDQFRTKGEH